MVAQTKYFSTLAGGKIDRTTCVISGVSVITLGQAKGHGLQIDSQTLETVRKVASEFSSGVKVKLRHRQDGEHQNVISDTAGTLRNFSIEGNKVRADFHLLKSLPAETREKIFEMAEVMPEEFGFSIHFSGVSEEKDGQKFARCQELQSIDLSDNPAANPEGLFSEGDKHKDGCDCDDCKKLSDKSKSKSMSAPTNEELALSISELTKLVAGMATKLDTKQSAKSITFMLDGKETELTGEQISAALSATNKLAADAAKNTDAALRHSVIHQMDVEGRVPMNPATKKAYMLSELNALPLETLQFAAINSPTIPLAARALYRGDAKVKIPAEVKGTERIHAAWSEKYDDLDKLTSAPIGATL